MSSITLDRNVNTSSISVGDSQSHSSVTCLLELPELMILERKAVIQQFSQQIYEAITSNDYIVLDCKNNCSIDKHGLQVLAELFQAAYCFTVGLSFINLGPQFEISVSFTGIEPSHPPIEAFLH
ncbi:hypothetical protein [Acaryochloris sp. IP29b_bin.137]|uniref:hypothetical protein n=1 Tax=Acaryochloris sp. IP29b_bin.137 TaxID=2969217 RepID=UPI00263A2A3E|nr:hypothetical protein [Acaryochloris sp. IP29b_bin.137]